MARHAKPKPRRRLPLVAAIAVAVLAVSGVAVAATSSRVPCTDPSEACQDARLAALEARVGALETWAGGFVPAGVTPLPSPSATPSLTPSSTPSPTVSATASGLLTWAPPTLVNPVTITPSTSQLIITIPTTQDARIQLPTTGPFDIPTTASTGLVIVGGHNVVMIGGAVSYPANHYPAVKFKGTTGAIHIEGVHLIGPNLGEGFQFQDVPGTVTMENVREDDLNTVNPPCGYSTYHCDGFQTYFSGPSQVRIDHLTGSTTYQFFMLQSSTGGAWDLRNVNIMGHPAPDGVTYWMMYDAGPAGSQIHWQNVYLWDQGRAPSQTKAVYTLGVGGSEPGLNLTPPPNGDFVPPGVAGPGYVSPGYA